MKGHDKPLRFSVEITQSCNEISRSNLSHCHEGKAFKCKVPSKSLSTRGDPESLFWLLLLFQKSDSSACSRTLWKIKLRLLFALRKLEGNAYFASWGKLTVWAFLPLPAMDKLCRGLSAGKQIVGSCLHCTFADQQVKLQPKPVISLCVILSFDQFNQLYSTKGKMTSAQCFSHEEKNTAKLETKT